MKFDNCLLCNRELKDKTIPLGSKCKKKMKKVMKVAVLNGSSGCHSNGGGIHISQDDLDEHFGNTIDMYIIFDYFWTQITFTIPGEGSYYAHAYGEWMDDEEEEYNENASDFVRAAVLMIGLGEIDLDLVHVDSAAIQHMQHSHYIGPAATIEDVCKRWSTDEAPLSCACNFLHDRIEELVEELEQKQELFGKTNPLTIAVRERLDHRLMLGNRSYTDIRLFEEASGEVLDEPMFSDEEDLLAHMRFGLGIND